MASVASLVSAGCGGGGVLRDRIDADPVEVHAFDDMIELHFKATAHVTDVVSDGSVHVEVTGGGAHEGGAGAGHVRVAVVRGALQDDPAPNDALVACGADDVVDVPHDALERCAGDCVQDFTVLFASEGLPPGTSVVLPVTLEASLVYESAVEAPAGDSLALTLQ